MPLWVFGFSVSPHMDTMSCLKTRKRFRRNWVKPEIITVWASWNGHWPRRSYWSWTNLAISALTGINRNCCLRSSWVAAKRATRLWPQICPSSSGQIYLRIPRCWLYSSTGWFFAVMCWIWTGISTGWKQPCRTRLGKLALYHSWADDSLFRGH